MVAIPWAVFRFGRPAADPVAAWRPVPRGLDLERICSFYTAATVLNDNTVLLAVSGRDYLKLTTLAGSGETGAPLRNVAAAWFTEDGP